MYLSPTSKLGYLSFNDADLVVVSQKLDRKCTIPTAS